MAEWEKKAISARTEISGFPLGIEDGRPFVGTRVFIPEQIVELRDALTELLDMLEYKPAVAPSPWTIGQELTKEDMKKLPIGAVVEDKDDDEWIKRSSGRWLNEGEGSESLDFVMRYVPITLVSLPS